MKPSTLLYAIACVLVLSYLTYANTRGYVPFTSNVATAARGATANHFHK